MAIAARAGSRRMLSKYPITGMKSGIKSIGDSPYYLLDPFLNVNRPPFLITV